jgi:peptide/nickel transport system permease protein
MVRRRLRSVQELPLAALAVLAVFVLIGIFAGQVAPHDPLAIDIPMRLQPPAFETGLWLHPLGTDELGRDVLSRVIFGARLSLAVGAVALIVGAVAGVAIGITAGYTGGITDVVLMRLTDLALSYPVILLALLLTVVFGPGPGNVIAAIAFVLWARFARVVRGQTLVIRELGYVLLARVAGASPLRIGFVHILPNVASQVIVLASLQAGAVILLEASLSFLGAGLPPPDPDWGSMIAAGRQYVVTAWWLPTVPGIAIMLLVLSLNMFGDWLRDRLDPRLRNL